VRVTLIGQTLGHTSGYAQNISYIMALVGEMAERDEPESNILQLCPLSKYLDGEACCKAIVPRGGSWKRPGCWAKFESHYVRLAHKLQRSINHQSQSRHRGCR
jgi:hypothetical protein